MKKTLSIITLFLLIFLLIYTTIIIAPSSQLVNLSSTWAKIRISIFDEQHQPIDMATICIVETNEYLSSGKLGQCELNFNTSAKINLFNNAKWEEFTILIYKNGYKPHIIYGLKAIPNITRTGIVITLKSTIYDNNKKFETSYDFPPNDYSNYIINSHKK